MKAGHTLQVVRNFLFGFQLLIWSLCVLYTNDQSGWFLSSCYVIIVFEVRGWSVGSLSWAVSLASVDVDSVAIRHTCVAALNLLIISIFGISILD